MKIIQKEYGAILIGTNARENWRIIDSSEDDDIWFHLKDYPSCHVIVQLKKEINSTEILEISKLVIENTNKYKNVKNLKISYCLIKDITKNKNKVGSVFIKNEKTILI